MPRAIRASKSCRPHLHVCACGQNRRDEGGASSGGRPGASDAGGQAKAALSLKQAGNDMFKRGQYTEAAYLYQSALDIIGQGTCTVSEVLCAWVCLEYSMRSPLLGPQHVTEALPQNIIFALSVG